MTGTKCVGGSEDGCARGRPCGSTWEAGAQGGAGRRAARQGRLGGSSAAGSSPLGAHVRAWAASPQPLTSSGHSALGVGGVPALCLSGPRQAPDRGSRPPARSPGPPPRSWTLNKRGE